MITIKGKTYTAEAIQALAAALESLNEEVLFGNEGSDRDRVAEVEGVVEAGAEAAELLKHLAELAGKTQIGVLIHDGEEEDFRLADGANGAYVGVDDIDVRVLRTETGVQVEAYGRHPEFGFIDSTTQTLFLSFAEVEQAAARMEQEAEDEG